MRGVVAVLRQDTARPDRPSVAVAGQVGGGAVPLVITAAATSQRGADLLGVLEGERVPGLRSSSTKVAVQSLMIRRDTISLAWLRSMTIAPRFRFVVGDPAYST